MEGKEKELILAVIILFGLCVPWRLKAEENLLFNPGFEKVALDGLQTGWKYDEKFWSSETEIVKDGKYSMKTNTPWKYLTQSIESEKGALYYLKFWNKTDDRTKKTRAQVHLTIGEGKNILWRKYICLAFDDKWHEYKFILPRIKEKNKITVSFIKEGGPGSVFIDSASSSSA